METLEQEAGGATAAASRAGMSYSQWVNLRSGAADSKTGKPRGMRKATARKIEAAFNKPDGWLDYLELPAGAGKVSGAAMKDALRHLIPDGGRAVIVHEPGSVYAHHPEDPLPDDAIAIKESRLVKFSAGNGHRIDFELIEESEPAIYRRSWLQREGLNPDHLRRFKVKGDSMEPFLFENDSVLVNLAENDPARLIDGKVYALRYGEDLRMKRLYRRIDGTLILRSDNPTYGDEPVPPHLAEEHITIIGRVRDKSGAGGL